jgi:hypothetical protein
MTFDTELGDRLRATTRSLPDLPDTLDEVMHRGQRRRVASRVAGVGGLALVAVAGVVVALTLGSDRWAPSWTTRRSSPTPAVTEDVTPEPSEVEVGIVTPGEIGWSLLVAGPDGVTWWDGADARIIDTEVAMTAIPLSEGGVSLAATDRRSHRSHRPGRHTPGVAGSSLGAAAPWHRNHRGRRPVGTCHVVGPSGGGAVRE